MDFGLDAILLARLQFALVVIAHIVFPAFSIGLASFLAVLEMQWLRTRDPLYMKVFDYWRIIFAVVFGMGVVSGITMSYQFGTNWSVFSDKSGPIIGPLMGYEVMSAFFLEAGFLGVMLFGRKRVGEKVHAFATLMVAIGTLFSAFWILSVNSWMQTPAGYGINEVGQYIPADWVAVIFNPSFPYRLVHMVLAAYLTTSFVVGSAAAWHLLKDRNDRAARLMFSMAMWMALLVTPVQIFAGDAHGLNTLEHQPAKVAAMEGHWETHGRAGFIVFGIPDDEAEKTHYKLEIPYASSLVLKHHIDGEVPGLGDWKAEDRPPMLIVFWSFRIMIAIGFAMLGLGLLSGLARMKGKLYDWPWLHKLAVVMGPSGFAAVIAGWITTEVGRQPWTIYGLLRTSESHSPLSAEVVGSTLLAYFLVYLTIFGIGTLYIIRLMMRPPPVADAHEAIGPARTASPALTGADKLTTLPNEAEEKEQDQ